MAGALAGYVAVQGFLLPRDAFLLPVIVLLVILFFFDLKWQVLPDVVTALLTAFALGRLFLAPPFSWMNGLAAGLFATGAVLLVYVVTKGNGIGFGDVKLAFPLGLLFGSPRLLGVVLTAVWAGALVGVMLMLLRRASLKTALPLGSFWTASALAALIWPAVADWPFRLLMP
jgi:prepilin signal peptidase PulO-like enzyme (type II secretory pathway)